MYYYIKIREKGNLIWKVLREDGKILVFNKYETVKEYAKGLNKFISQIVSIPYHPMHKRSPIYGKRYTKMDL